MWPLPICVVSLWYVFHSLIFIAIDHTSSIKQSYLFFVHFLEYLLLFLDDNGDEESE